MQTHSGPEDVVVTEQSAPRPISPNHPAPPRRFNPDAELNYLQRAHTAVQALQRLGVPRTVLISTYGPIAGVIGLARVRLERSGLFTFAPDDGVERIVLGIRSLETGELLDLIAINIKRPDECWRRFGTLDFLPNQYPVLRSVATGDPLLVQPNVLAWLRRNLQGVTILDHSRAWWMLRGAFKIVAAGGIDHGLEIDSLLRGRDPSVPEIVIPTEVAT